jgi:hypothetical protein
MENPAFGLDDPRDVLVIVDEQHETETVELNREDGQYTHWHVDPPCTYESVYEYRIDGTKVLQRLLGQWHDEEGKTLHEVKDNVVLESEIRKYWTLKAKTTGLWEDDLEGAEKQAEYAISTRGQYVEWHELSWPLVRYFILSRHPELLPGLEYRRFFRQELERIATGTTALLNKGLEMGAELHETSYGASLRLPESTYNSDHELSDDCKCDRCKVADELIELQGSPNSLIQFNISASEFAEGKKLTRFLRGLLGET